MSWGVFDDDWERRKIDGDKSMNEVSDKSKVCFDDRSGIGHKYRLNLSILMFTYDLRSDIRSMSCWLNDRPGSA